ncbi:MAG TPA: acetate kinase [Gemmatimonadales bacterium]|nr:acetate kinase [Gemmatimonadales bacterium]
MRILVLNSGSSSQKSRLYELAAAPPDLPPPPLWEATIEWDGGAAELAVRTARGAPVRERVNVGTRGRRGRAIERMLASLWVGSARVVASPAEIDVVGHRVVHGGDQFQEPVAVTPAVKAAIARFAMFAPLHNRAELDGMDTVERLLGSVLQVAVFDTAFHRHLPQSAAVYPGPYEWLARGIRRYGFHGINHEACAHHAAQLLGRELRSLRLVTCHLGNGCSLAAIRDGHSIDTTMGFTPLDGLMMGTRSGAIDPGILTYLLQQGKVTPRRLDELLNTRSGLLGISGVSGDMREILAAGRAGHARAQLAFDMFVHRLQSSIGAMAAVLGGLDALVFTAGIGEHSPEVRAAACANLGFLGLELDAEKNAYSPSNEDISRAGARARVLIVRAEEDWAITRACWRVAAGRTAAGT